MQKQYLFLTIMLIILILSNSVNSLEFGEEHNFGGKYLGKKLVEKEVSNKTVLLLIKSLKNDILKRHNVTKKSSLDEKINLEIRKQYNLFYIKYSRDIDLKVSQAYVLTLKETMKQAKKNISFFTKKNKSILVGINDAGEITVLDNKEKAACLFEGKIINHTVKIFFCETVRKNFNELIDFFEIMKTPNYFQKIFLTNNAFKTIVQEINNSRESISLSKTITKNKSQVKNASIVFKKNNFQKVSITPIYFDFLKKTIASEVYVFKEKNKYHVIEPLTGLEKTGETFEEAMEKLAVMIYPKNIIPLGFITYRNDFDEKITKNPFNERVKTIQIKNIETTYKQIATTIGVTGALLLTTGLTGGLSLIPISVGASTIFSTIGFSSLLLGTSALNTNSSNLLNKTSQLEEFNAPIKKNEPFISKTVTNTKLKDTKINNITIQVPWSEEEKLIKDLKEKMSEFVFEETKKPTLLELKKEKEKLLNDLEEKVNSQKWSEINWGETLIKYELITRNINFLKKNAEKMSDEERAKNNFYFNQLIDWNKVIEKYEKELTLLKSKLNNEKKVNAFKTLNTILLEKIYAIEYSEPLAMITYALNGFGNCKGKADLLLALGNDLKNHYNFEKYFLKEEYQDHTDTGIEYERKTKNNTIKGYLEPTTGLFYQKGKQPFTVWDSRAILLKILLNNNKKIPFSIQKFLKSKAGKNNQNNTGGYKPLGYTTGLPSLGNNINYFGPTLTYSAKYEQKINQKKINWKFNEEKIFLNQDEKTIKIITYKKNNSKKSFKNKYGIKILVEKDKTNFEGIFEISDDYSNHEAEFLNIAYDYYNINDSWFLVEKFPVKRVTTNENTGFKTYFDKFNILFTNLKNFKNSFLLTKTEKKNGLIDFKNYLKTYKEILNAASESENFIEKIHYLKLAKDYLKILTKNKKLFKKYEKELTNSTNKFEEKICLELNKKTKNNKKKYLDSLSLIEKENCLVLNVKEEVKKTFPLILKKFFDLELKKELNEKEKKEEKVYFEIILFVKKYYPKIYLFFLKEKIIPFWINFYNKKELTQENKAKFLTFLYSTKDFYPKVLKIFEEKFPNSSEIKNLQPLNELFKVSSNTKKFKDKIKQIYKQYYLTEEEIIRKNVLPPLLIAFKEKKENIESKKAKVVLKKLIEVDKGLTVFTFFWSVTPITPSNINYCLAIEFDKEKNNFEEVGFTLNNQVNLLELKDYTAFLEKNLGFSLEEIFKIQNNYFEKIKKIENYSNNYQYRMNVAIFHMGLNLLTIYSCAGKIINTSNTSKKRISNLALTFFSKQKKSSYEKELFNFLTKKNYYLKEDELTEYIKNKTSNDFEVWHKLVYAFNKKENIKKISNVLLKNIRTHYYTCSFKSSKTIDCVSFKQGKDAYCFKKSYKLDYVKNEILFQEFLKENNYFRNTPKQTLSFIDNQVTNFEQRKKFLNKLFELKPELFGYQKIIINN